MAPGLLYGGGLGSVGGGGFPPRAVVAVTTHVGLPDVEKKTKNALC